MMANEHDLLVALVKCATVFEIADGVTIEACRQPDRTVKWAVRMYGAVLTRQLAWEWEPFPSNRTDAFLQRARFATIVEAVDAAERCGDISLTCTFR